MVGIINLVDNADHGDEVVRRSSDHSMFSWNGVSSLID